MVLCDSDCFVRFTDVIFHVYSESSWSLYFVIPGDTSSIIVRIIEFHGHDICLFAQRTSAKLSQENRDDNVFTMARNHACFILRCNCQKQRKYAQESECNCRMVKCDYCGAEININVMELCICSIFHNIIFILFWHTTNQ